MVALDKRQMGEMVIVSAQRRKILHQVGRELQLSVNQFYKNFTNSVKNWRRKRKKSKSFYLKT